MASLLNDPKLEALLSRLHAESDAQIEETNAYFAGRAKEGTLDSDDFFDEDAHRFFSDKLVALDRDKAERARANFKEAADGPQPAQGSPCAPSFACTGHGPGCRMGL